MKINSFMLLISLIAAPFCSDLNSCSEKKIVDVDYVNPAEVFTNSYGLTKRRMYVPCEYDTLQSAQLQIINWSNISDFTVDI